MKMLPKTLGNQDRIDWVPMDLAAATVLDVSMNPLNKSSEHAQVYHLTNPRTTSWKELYPIIRAFYKESNVDIEAVDYDDWVDELKKLPRTKENAEAVPGLKLLEFYESLRPGSEMGLPALETQKSEEASQSLREGKGVDEEVMRKWLDQWAF
jgi:ABC-type thiamine transport system substrate-binding protein